MGHRTHYTPEFSGQHISPVGIFPNLYSAFTRILSQSTSCKHQFAKCDSFQKEQTRHPSWLFTPGLIRSPDNHSGRADTPGNWKRRSSPGKGILFRGQKACLSIVVFPGHLSLVVLRKRKNGKADWSGQGWFRVVWNLNGSGRHWKITVLIWFILTDDIK